MAASSPRDFHYTRQALCNDWQDELKLIKSPPLSPAFLPRGFYSKCLALEIRNRHLPANLFHFGYFFQENYGGRKSRGVTSRNVNQQIVIVPIITINNIIIIIIIIIIRYAKQMPEIEKAERNSLTFTDVLML